MIKEALLNEGMRDMLFTIHFEIDRIINLKIYDVDAVNVYPSAWGRPVRFFVKNPHPADSMDCEIDYWDDWLMLPDRIKFKWAARRAGIRRINKIEVPEDDDLYRQYLAW